MGIPISGLPELPLADEGDLIPIYDASGNITKRVTVEGLAAVVGENLPIASVSASALGAIESLGAVNADSVTGRVVHGYVSNGTNVPEAYGYLINLPHPTASTHDRQLYFSPNDTNAWTRTRISGTWSAWKPLTPIKTTANGWTTYDHGTYKEHMCWVNIPASNTTLSYVSSPTIPDGKVRNNFYASITSGIDSRVVLGLSNPDSTLTTYSISFVTFTGTAGAFPATLRIVEK